MASTSITNFAHLRIPLEDVVNATNNFHHDNLIGRGGLGKAYQGRLERSGKSIKITALRLDRKETEDVLQFWTEISLLSDLKNKNIVSIVGFCDEKQEKIIVTTHAAKGSLQQHLNSSGLTWTQRLKICLGVARALRYLHYDERRGYGVVHLNINSSTILLDENWEAKLSGFKVSIKQSLKRMDRVILSEPIGTLGYIDLETITTKGVTHKTDIYAFGVVLFEILCGRKAFIPTEADGGMFIAELAKCHYEKKTLEDIIHHTIWNQMSSKSRIEYTDLAYSCINKERAHRPNINHIVAELENVLNLELRYENLVKNLGHLKIHHSDIKLATNNFSVTNLIRRYSFYNLYRAALGDFDKENPSFIDEKNAGEQPKRHNDVVIKLFYDIDDDKRKDDFFFTEIEILTNVKHCNIVTLRGFCVEDSHMIIVIESVPNEYLGDYLDNVNDMRILTWEKRLKICIDVARALNYLHYEMEHKKVIINRVINSENIWLDENFGAKIVDFGFSIYLPPNQDDDALFLDMIAGIQSYWDPEYERSGKLKRESDVYSFGVVLFEILCGKRAYDPIYQKGSHKGLAFVARQCFPTRILEMMDPIINRGPNESSLKTFIDIAYHCVAETQDQRPTMKVVVKELEKALVIQEGRVQRPYIEQVFNKQEDTLELHQKVQEEDVQRLNRAQVVEIEKQSEQLPVTDEFHGKNLENLKIPLRDIKLATDNFSYRYKIMSTEYYTWYRAGLSYFVKEDPMDGNNKGEQPKRHNTILIKRFINVDNKQAKEVFYRDIEMLTSVKHSHIVNLLVFCVEDSEMVLVVEDVSNGSLRDYMQNIKNMYVLTWEKRLKICLDVAHALSYLHSDMEHKKVIIHRDIISDNIWLDENFGAKIVDFGFSIYLPPNQDDDALFLDRIAGTRSYLDPEYERSGKLKRESDVYSFGVVLFEILCGRISYDRIYLKENGNGLAPKARQSFENNTIMDMIDHTIKEEINENSFILNRGPNKDSLDVFIKIAYRCVAETQDKRPTMKVVVKELETALAFQTNNMDNPKISLQDIKLITREFCDDNYIGRGGFGKVYKGNLLDHDGTKIVVAKRLNTRGGQGEHEFLSELQFLLEYKHENIIGLVGYCDEEDEKVIVYEYAHKGSLDMYLGDPSLTWVKRLNICIDVASALYFIHEGDEKQAKVIHRDIKTANILLNHDWKAKLADFGLCLISPLVQETDFIMDRACGTPGYLDPLYRKSGFLTIESDIYSFGVVLFEILCGRSTYATYQHELHYLPDFVKNKFEERKDDEVVFEQIREQIMPESLITFQSIAYQCLHHEREKRPTTKQVLSQLKKALDIQEIYEASKEKMV